MSALGSSVINKSRKKLAPRAPPPRRRPAAAVDKPQDAHIIPSASLDSSETSPSVATRNASALVEGEPILTSETAEPVEAPPNKKRKIGLRQSARRSETQEVEEAAANLLNGQPGEDSSEPQSTVLPSIPSPIHSTRARRNLNAVSNDAPTNTQRSVPSPSQRATRSTRSNKYKQSNGELSEDTAPTVAAEHATAVNRRSSNTIRTEKVDQQIHVASTRGNKRKRASDVENSAKAPAEQQQRQKQPPEISSDISTASKTARANKRKAEAEPDESLAESEEQPQDLSEEQADSDQAAPSKPRRKRRQTPEGADKHVIDPSATLMFDLTKDSKKGQKSKLESEFQEIDWSEVVRLRKEAEARAREELMASPSRDQQTPGVSGQAEGEPQGPRLKLVNGQIVLDNSSLLVDRHAAAVPNADQPAVEERDITRRINSRTWMHDNRRDPEERQLLSGKSDPWSADATDRFYSALRMWGTDFFMISKMFPGRTRRHIKLKFVREERANPDRIKNALVGGSVPMDLEAYCEATGKTLDDYKDPAVLQEELKAEEERQREEIERQKEEQADAQRKKQELAAAKTASGRARKPADKSGGARSRKKKMDPVDSNLVPATDVVESIEA